MCVVAVGNSTGGVAKDFDRRLRHVFIVVRRARLAKILEHPRTLLTRFNAPLRWYPGNGAQHSKSVVGSSPSAEEDWSIGIRGVGHDTSKVQSNRAVHRSPKRLVGFHTAIEEPAVRTGLLDLPVG